MRFHCLGLDTYELCILIVQKITQCVRIKSIEIMHIRG